MKNKIRLAFTPIPMMIFLISILMMPGCGGGGKKEPETAKKSAQRAVRKSSQGNVLVSDPISGRKVFEDKYCSQCHSILDEEEKVGPNLETSSFYGSFLDIFSILWNHAPAMAVHMRKEGLKRPQFSTVELNELVSFLYMLPYFGTPGNASRGSVLLAEKACLNCHSIAGKGMKGGIALDSLKEYSSQVALMQQMWNHGPVMLSQMIASGTSIPKFSGNEMMDLFAALSSSGSGKSRKVAIAIGDAERGKKVFEKKSCSKCHSVFGKGGSEGPDLSDSISQSGVGKLTSLLWNHAAEMQEKFRKKKIKWPYFSETEMSDLIVYLYSLNYLDPPGNPDKGGKVFTEKKCAGCHLSPEGSYREIMGRVKNLNSLQFATHLWNHFPTMEAAMVTTGIDWPELGGQELRDIHSFLMNR